MDEWFNRFGKGDNGHSPNIWVDNNGVRLITVTQDIEGVYTMCISVAKSPVNLVVRLFSLPDEEMFYATVTAAIAGLCTYQMVHENLWGVT